MDVIDNITITYAQREEEGYDIPKETEDILGQCYHVTDINGDLVQWYRSFVTWPKG